MRDRLKNVTVEELDAQMDDYFNRKVQRRVLDGFRGEGYLLHVSFQDFPRSFSSVAFDEPGSSISACSWKHTRQHRRVFGHVKLHHG